MQKAPISKKRPCRICRRWFMPNARLKDRQMTCGDDRCKRELHRRKCSEWNRNNPDYFKTNYLQKKLDAATQADRDSDISTASPKPRLKSGLPLRYVQEVIGIQHLIITEYLAQLLIRRFQEALRGQLIVNTRYPEQLPVMEFSRRDRL